LLDTNERFNQLEGLLVDLTRKVDRQGEILDQHSAILALQGEAIARQEVRLNNIGEQLGDVITILKLSEARHTQAEQRQDAMLVEIQRQGQRLDASVEAIKALFKRQENTDARLDAAVQTQLQMLQLLRLDADKVDDLAQRLPAAEGQEPRIKLLEDKVFRAAS
jgi:hypothetical protein